MSQEKTEVGFGPFSGRNNDPYARSSARGGQSAHEYRSEGTVIPGMEQLAPGAEMKHANNTTREPVVGFLYSISRQGIGEFWPLHVGRNTIGRAENCDVRLRERTVSDLHAALNIKQMKTTHKVLASLKDEGSKNGIFINDNELDYDAHACVNNDIITIGLHYKLLLILIDTETLGLTVSEEFLDDEEEAVVVQPEQPVYDPQRTGFNPYDRRYRPTVNTNETISMEGTFNPGPGKTEIM